MEENDKNRHIVTMTAKEFTELIKETIDVKFSIFIKHFEKENSKSSPENLISRIKLANHFFVTPKTIDKWVKHGELPKPIKIGGRKYFKISDIEKLKK